MLVASTAFCGCSFATPEFLKTFKAHFPAQAQADCTTCHTKPPARNDFGKLVGDTMDAQNVDVLNDVVLDRVSTVIGANGKPIGEGLKAGAPALDALTKPDPPKPPPPDPIGFIPKHSMHPAIIHFPIALFVFALALEILGLRFKKPELNSVALWSLGGGVLMAVPSIATGLMALFRQGIGFTSISITHLVLVVVSTLLALGAAILKAKGKAGVGYWILLVLSCAVIAAGAHIGSLMVYG